MADTYTVQPGDTLWSIARKYGTTYQKLAEINNLSDPNYIRDGWVLKLTGSASNASNTSSANGNKPTITAFGPQSNNQSTLFATWTWADEANTASYKVLWSYDTGNGVWFTNGPSDNSVNEHFPEASRQSTFSIPSNAKSVKFKVKPVSKTKDDKGTVYWTAEWSNEVTYNVAETLNAPSSPSVTIEDFTLTAVLDDLDPKITQVEFQVVRDDTVVFKTGKASVTVPGGNTRGFASFSCNVNAGSKYKACCRTYKGTIVSDWSGYSSAEETIPSVPGGITTCRASSATSVYLEWSAVTNAKSYDLEYATKREYLDGSNNTTQKTGIEFTHYDLTGLESGSEYFFRVRAVNGKGHSTWSSIKSVIIGKNPSAPTTWSNTTTVITGEPLILYWVHNSEDGSSQKYAELELYIGGKKEVKTIRNTTNEDEKDKTLSYHIDTSSYKEGVQIQWRVRTAGITNTYGDWSVQRTVDVYSPPTLELRMTDVKGNAIRVLESFPFYISGLTGPNTQAPIGYHVSIVSNDIYETSDNAGNVKIVNRGEEVYSRHFDISEKLTLELSAQHVDLENNVNYTLTCVASMNSGLTVESSIEFTVAWTDDVYSPNAEINVDFDTYTAHIRPYCENAKFVQHRVTKDGSKYVTTDNVIKNGVYSGVFTASGEKVYLGINPYGVETYYCMVHFSVTGVPIDPACYKVNNSNGTYTMTATSLNRLNVKSVFTTTGERVLMGVTESGEEVLYCEVKDAELVEDVTLSVYRREFNGKFTELATNLDNLRSTFVTDPHPALDYARYRVVAQSKKTGAVSFYDIPGFLVGGTAAIIQWDEAWSNFDIVQDETLEQPPWSGSMLKLPYNIDVSDSHDADVALVEYIGRTHPTSYYGTQLGETSTWSVAIEKDDEETLYTLRRLASWLGDVYVREPSGTGYWASVKVSFSQKHKDMTIPVSINITRVEGGV